MTAVDAEFDDVWRAKISYTPDTPWDEGTGRCIGCVRAGRGCRYGIVREWREGERMRAVAVLGGAHEGGPGVAHGGVVAALLDEVLGHLPWSHGAFSVTKALQVRYLRPVPLGQELSVSASGDRDTASGVWQCHGRVTVAATNTVVAEATGTWVERDYGHYLRFRRLMGTPGGPG